MNEAVPCAECEAILDDFRGAAGMPTREQASGVRDTLRALLAADDEGLDEFIEKRRFRARLDGSIDLPRPSRQRLEALHRRAWEHRARTGHWPLPFR
jgi:hypothetical protein